MVAGQVASVKVAKIQVGHTRILKKKFITGWDANTI
jgi:hypothetical protein